MKWSEQMRVLQSEDEHYNQLMLDTVTGELFINDELIAVLNDSDGVGFTMQDYKFKNIIKKYPFFDDIKFLLNCIFKTENSGSTSYIKSNDVTKYNVYYDIYCASLDKTLRIYFKKPEIS